MMRRGAGEENSHSVSLTCFSHSTFGVVLLLLLGCWVFSLTCTCLLCWVQGPLPGTSGHFWLAVWEQDTKGILMLNRVFEKGMVTQQPSLALRQAICYGPTSSSLM